VGLYLDTSDKPAWLAKNATSLTAGELDQYIAGTNDLSGLVPLALMQNPWGPTVAILFDKREAARFRQGRTDLFFFATERANLKEWLS
jgi:hypothetical protein